MKKQMQRVIDALVEGAQTSREVSDITGLPLHHCSAWLNELRLAGIAKIVRRNHIRFNDRHRYSHQWALVEGGQHGR